MDDNWIYEGIVQKTEIVLIK